MIAEETQHFARQWQQLGVKEAAPVMPEEPTPPVDPSPANEPEWTDDSPFTDDSTFKEATPTTPLDSSPGDEPEWTDDSAFDDLARPLPAETTANEPPTDEWEAANLDWEDDYTDAEEPAAAPTTREALAWVKPAWRQFRSVWQRLLAGLRNRIPAAADISDTVLSAILIGILGVLLVILNSLRQPSVAVEPTVSDSPPAGPVAIAPSEQPTPPEAATPPSPAVVAEPAAETPPPAADVVDIERIGKIQAQLTDSSIYNASRVVDSVQADFSNNRLTLICNEDWFRLSDYDQTLLANQLLNQSAELSFQDLQLQTAEGQLIARNPVIGDEMVILLREKPPEVQPPERPRYRITIDR